MSAASIIGTIRCMKADVRRRSPDRMRWLSAAVVAACVVTWSAPAYAYLKFGYQVNGVDHTLRWTTTPIRYYVTEAGVPGISSTAFQQAVGRAFSSWAAVPTASLSYQFAGFTANLPGEDDGRSTLGFLYEPDLDRVLASTSYLIDEVTGELIESDIFFNAAYTWSVSPTGEAGKWDLESTALHEIGHLNGLGHSAIGETQITPGDGREVLSVGATMFPISIGQGDVSGRKLHADDIAGISDLYPAAGFRGSTGSTSGRITRNGAGIFGAHVVAIDLATGDMVGNFSLTTSGAFSIAGLRAGPHLLRVEPLDDADPASFFDPSEPTDVTFRAKYYERLIVVPRGGDTGSVEVKVVAK
jgi:hypothetical protein